MKIDFVEIERGDVVLIRMDIGVLAGSAADEYVNKHMPLLKETFSCPITVIPFRGIGDGTWDFTVVRNRNRKPVKAVKKRNR